MTKQEILREIQRVAAISGGKAPGRSTFFNATGIKENDWSGKYWSRWSDAIREAGLSPNRMTAGYEKDFLIEKLIQLASEIGRFPGSRDMRLKAHTEKGFPSSKTFETHFGAKEHLVSRVAEYCANKGGLEDVLEFCGKASLGKQSKMPETLDGKPTIGLVYLIKSGRHYKIGKTASIGRRVYDLALQLAEKPTTVHVIKTDDPDGVEEYWHKRFAAKRLNGEWFRLSPPEIRCFKRWIRIA